MSILCSCIELLCHLLQLLLQPHNLALRVCAQSLMSVQHLLDLSFILALKNLDNGLLIVLSFFLVLVTPLLQLLDCHLKLLLRFNQVSLVIVFLSLEEHNLSFPQSLVSIVVTLQILELSLSLLKLTLHLHQIFSLHRSIMIGLVGAIIQIS